MGTKALISQEETHLISLLRIAATLGVLLIHVNQRLPLPGLLGVDCRIWSRRGKMLFLFDRVSGDEFVAEPEIDKGVLEEADCQDAAHLLLLCAVVCPVSAGLDAERCLVHTQSTFNAAILGTTNSIV